MSGDTVSFDAETTFVGDNEQLYRLEVHAEAEVVRGPLGRFVDLAEQIESEGGVVPAEITELLCRLQLPQETES